MSDTALWICPGRALCLVLALSGWLLGAADGAEPVGAPAGNAWTAGPEVIAPPASFFEWVDAGDREVARRFYRKYVDIQGVPVLAAEVVADTALRRTHELVTRLLAGRPDVLAAMASNRMYLIIIGKDQVYTDMPEYRNHPNPEYQNLRVRGTGGRPTSFGEENLLSLPVDRYDDESIGLHEFCHTVDSTLSAMDRAWSRRLRELYKQAMDRGLWRYSYSASNPAEYWAEAVTMYFDCDRPNNWNHGPVFTREQLRSYDPDIYHFIRETLRLKPSQDWRYAWLQPLPNVIRPPARFGFDPYYQQFTYAREFPVLGSGKVSEAALLKANDTIRKLFAYRHDVLKAMIDAGARLVILGRQESLSDLPEFKAERDAAGFDQPRCWDYTPERKLMVVPEENVLSVAREPVAGQSLVVEVMAKAMLRIAAARPVDAGFERRPGKQQYELRVKRMDVEFDARLAKLFEETRAKGRWRGTPAARDRVEYWAAGVSAYFDAVGDGYPPTDAPRPIASREALQAYDSELYGLVDETMAYNGRVDWRYQPYRP